MEYLLYLRNDELEVTINVEYYADYQPAKLSGPPEDCYPDCSSLEIEDWTVLNINDLSDNGDHSQPSPKELCDAFQADRERIEEACWEDFEAKRHEGRCDE